MRGIVDESHRANRTAKKGILIGPNTSIWTNCETSVDERFHMTEHLQSAFSPLE